MLQSPQAECFYRLHPHVIAVAEDLFFDRYYGNAVFEAFKALEVRVRHQSGIDASGADLMARALAGGGPIDIAHELGRSGADEQLGFRFLFMGAMSGIRNPKGHEPVRRISPTRAMDYLSVASLLMRRLDDAVLMLRDRDPDTADRIVHRIEEATPGSIQGRMEGTIGYPSSGVPPMRVYAISSLRHSLGNLVETHRSDRVVEFAFDELVPGDYHVLAYPADGRELAGGFTQFVKDGLRQGHDDHSLLKVQVRPGATTKGVEVTDWYWREWPPEPGALRPPVVRR